MAQRRVTILGGIGTVLTSLALSALSSALGSSYWVTVTVDREAIASLAADDVTSNGTLLNEALVSDQLYFTHNRGLFHTCFDDDNQIFTCTLRVLIILQYKLKKLQETN